MNNSEESFQKKELEFNELLKKTILEPYTADLFSYFYTTDPERSGGSKMDEEKKEIQSLLRQSYELVQILRDLRNSVVRWGALVITDLYVSPTIVRLLQNELLELLKETGVYTGLGQYDKYYESVWLEAIRNSWSLTLAIIPDESTLEFGEDDLLTDSSFSELADGIEKCYKQSSKLFSTTNDVLVAGFLNEVKDTHVQLCNKTYREVYNCLRFFGLIDPEILRVHDLSDSKYVRENYIKAKFLRLKEDDFNLSTFLSDVVDWDWYK